MKNARKLAITLKDIPDNIVETREGKSHGLKVPTPITGDDIADLIILCDSYHLPGSFNKDIEQTIAAKLPERCRKDGFKAILSLIGLDTWRKCVDFVKDDTCIEAGQLVHEWIRSKGIQARENKDFIDDASGIGFYKRLVDNTKEMLEKCFDEKYLHKFPRPLRVLEEKLGLVSAFCIVNYPHPGHYSYPAGHGGKFAAVFKTAKELYDLGEYEDILLTMMAVLACARTGGGVHFLDDNLASFALAGIEGFEKYLK